MNNQTRLNKTKREETSKYNSKLETILKFATNFLKKTQYFPTSTQILERRLKTANKNLWYASIFLTLTLNSQIFTF